MDYILCSVVACFIGFVSGVLFSKHVVSEAEHIKEHVSEEVGTMEGRLRAEFADMRSKVASKFREN